MQEYMTYEEYLQNVKKGTVTDLGKTGHAAVRYVTREVEIMFLSI